MIRTEVTQQFRERGNRVGKAVQILAEMLSSKRSPTATENAQIRNEFVAFCSVAPDLAQDSTTFLSFIEMRLKNKELQLTADIREFILGLDQTVSTTGNR